MLTQKHNNNISTQENPTEDANNKDLHTTLNHFQDAKSKSILLVSFSVLVMSLLITWIVWNNVSANTYKIAENRFNIQTVTTKNAILNRLESYQSILRGIKGLFISSDDVSRQEFRIYADSLLSENKLYGVQAIGYAPYIYHNQVNEFITKAQKELPSYRVRPDINLTKNDHVFVYYNEPTKPSNIAALGFDMYSEPMRRESLKLSRETGEVQITNKISLIQDNVKYPAFIMYMPIYKMHMKPPSDINERKKSHTGFAVVATRFKDLMDGILEQSQAIDIEVEIYDGQIIRQDKLVFDSHEDINQQTYRKVLFSQQHQIEINGKIWLVNFMSSEPFENSIDHSAEISVVISGILISGLLFTIVWILSHTRTKAVHIANTMTSAFRQSEQRYRQMFLKNQSVKLLVDSNSGEIIDANEAASIFYGYTLRELKLMNIDDIGTIPFSDAKDEMLQSTYETGQYFKTKHRLSNGEERDVEVYLGIVEIEGRILLHSIIHDITQRIRIEESQQKTETQLIKQLFFTQTLIDTLPNPIFYKDINGRYLGCNKAFENYIGLSQDSIIGKTVSDISPTELSKQYHEKDLTLLQEKGFQIYESSVRFADGSYRDVIFNKAVFYESDGQLGGLVGIIIDISERKQMEDRLRQVNDKLRNANEQLALVLEGSHDGFWDLDFSKHQVQMSQRLQLILGYYEHEQIPTDFDSWLKRIHPDDIQHVQLLFNEHILAKSSHYVGEFRILCKNTEYKWVMVRGRVVKRDSFNQPLRCTGILSDITERKQFEERLHRQKEFLRQVIDSDPNIIFVKNNDGKIVLTNEAMAKIFETTIDKIIYKYSEDFMTPENALSCHDTDQYVLMANQIITTEEEIISPSGKIHHFLITKKPLILEEDGMMQILCVGLNITESKKAEFALRESETRLKEVTSSLGEAIYVMNSQGNITFCNPELTKILGFSEQELLGNNAHNLFHHTYDNGEPYPSHDCSIIKTVFSGQEYRLIEDTFWTKHHQKVPVSVIAIPIIRHGVIEGAVVSFHDVSKEIVIRQTLHQALLEQEIILETMVVGVALLSNRKITWINSRLEEMLGYDRSEVINNTTEMFFGTKEKWISFGEEIMPKLYNGETYAGEHELYHKNGEVLWCTLNGKMIDINDSDRGVIWIIQDITERKKFEEKIRFMAHYDSLTQLPNRVMFRDRLEQALIRAHRGKFKLAVMFIDLDKFKFVNDTLGHGIGDKLLQHVSNRLLNCIRRSDTVARFGGDEFVVLLPEIRNEEDVRLVSQKIIYQLTEVFIIENNHLNIGCSIGISCYPKDGDNSETLMKNADIAMYRVKENGRNNFAFY